jgi:succinate dehydrogenase/fumarate reductase flavoprotein subunit
MNAAMASQKWSFEIPPAPIADSDIANTVETEIVVVGCGTSGLVTANSAAENGAKVVLITGSSAPISRGGSNHATNSKVMEKQGFKPYDAGEFFKKELSHASYNVDQDKWFKFYNNSPEAMNWLIDKMEAAGYQCVLEGGYTDPKDSQLFMPTGAHSFIGDDIKKAGQGQPLVVKTLAKTAEASGVKIVYKMVAEQLVRENNNTGRVTAVIAKGEDGKYTKYVGSKAIVLATGDFSADKEMMAKYCPTYIPLLDGTGDQGYDTAFKVGGLYKGDGQKMGLWVGAAWQKTFPNAPMILSGVGPAPYDYTCHPGLIVNKNGYRFGNEDTLFALEANTQMHQPELKAFAIWDSNYADAMKPWLVQGQVRGADPIPPADIVAGWEKSVKSKAYVKADTIEDLIKQLGLPAEATKATIDRYNEFCKNGVDADYHKRAERLVAIEKGPFYGSASQKPVFLTVMGGLRTNINMQVCDENDQPIPGLFNVGTMVGDYYANTYNFIVEGNNYGASCVTFGYVTGRAIAKGEIA